MKRWYVTRSHADETSDPRFLEAIWTVSLDPTQEGWITDSGCGGYGLTFAQATELADAANAMWLKNKEK